MKFLSFVLLLTLALPATIVSLGIEALHRWECSRNPDVVDCEVRWQRRSSRSVEIEPQVTILQIR